jgi:tetratricopeptide (TPR) repeat protein
MHPDDETLFEYADDPERVANADEIAEHLSDCAECTALVESARQLEALLSDRGVWEYADERDATSGVPEELLAVLRMTIAEDREAKALLDPLLSNPFAFIWTDLASKPRFRTAGVVRRLCEEVLSTVEVDPPHARDLADAAMLVVESLDSSRYTDEELTTLRGQVWRARATALRRLGDLSGALEALERAKRELASLYVRPIAFADIAYVRADVLSALGRLAEAADEIQVASDAFASQGRTMKYLQARLLRGVIAIRQGDYAAARSVLLPLLDQAEADGDAAIVAGVAHNLGAMYVDLGDPALASRYLLTAVSGWQALDKPTEAARAQWLMARLLLSTGRYVDAAERLAVVQRLFETFEMADDTALVRLQRVEALLLAKRGKEARALCRGLVEELIDLGIKRAAYTALAYVQELAAADRLNVPAVRTVGDFLRRLREDPALIFAPPPPEAPPGG